MRIKTIVATALLASVGLFAPAFAQNSGHAQLRLTLVDAANAAVPNATVTIYTIQGPRTVTADEKGHVVVADLPAELTQVWGRTAGLSGAEATKLKAGRNEQTLTLHAADSKSAESGS